MAAAALAFRSCVLLLSLLLHSVFLIRHQVRCDEEEDLLQGINAYRASLSLPTLVKNSNADCLAGEMADQFKNQACTNSTGSNTVPGTEPQLGNYPSLLQKCHLNISDTRDGVIMPACVPNLVPAIVLTNFTKSQYSQSLNDTKFTGAGIGSDNDWIVVVLTTSSPGGSFENAKGEAAAAPALVAEVRLIYLPLSLLIGFLFL